MSNDFDLKAEQIADLYRKCWQIELFFKKTQAELKDKEFHWNHGKRRDEPDLDSCRGDVIN